MNLSRYRHNSAWLVYLVVLFLLSGCVGAFVRAM